MKLVTLRPWESNFSQSNKVRNSSNLTNKQLSLIPTHYTHTVKRASCIRRAQREERAVYIYFYTLSPSLYALFLLLHIHTHIMMTMSDARQPWLSNPSYSELVSECDSKSLFNLKQFLCTCPLYLISRAQNLDSKWIFLPFPSRKKICRICKSTLLWVVDGTSKSQFNHSYKQITAISLESKITFSIKVGWFFTLLEDKELCVDFWAISFFFLLWSCLLFSHFLYSYSCCPKFLNGFAGCLINK